VITEFNKHKRVCCESELTLVWASYWTEFENIFFKNTPEIDIRMVPEQMVQKPERTLASG
jgi:hypothetical protein